VVTVVCVVFGLPLGMGAFSTGQIQAL
jgi:hypothetical protein